MKLLLLFHDHDCDRRNTLYQLQVLLYRVTRLLSCRLVVVMGSVVADVVLVESVASSAPSSVEAADCVDTAALLLSKCINGLPALCCCGTKKCRGWIHGVMLCTI